MASQAAWLSGNEKLAHAIVSLVSASAAASIDASIKSGRKPLPALAPDPPD
jgi:hypothetical protein